jgi:hypothetical protein
MAPYELGDKVCPNCGAALQIPVVGRAKVRVKRPVQSLPKAKPLLPRFRKRAPGRVSHKFAVTVLSNEIAYGKGQIFLLAMLCLVNGMIMWSTIEKSYADKAAEQRIREFMEKYKDLLETECDIKYTPNEVLIEEKQEKTNIGFMIFLVFAGVSLAFFICCLRFDKAPLAILYTAFTLFIAVVIGSYIVMFIYKVKLLNLGLISVPATVLLFISTIGNARDYQAVLEKGVDKALYGDDGGSDAD